MSSSFVELRSVGFWAHDSLLRIWVAFLIQEIDRLIDQPAWLIDVRTAWFGEAVDCRQGTHSLYLDRFITSANHKAVALKLAHVSLSSIGELDDGANTAPGRLPSIAIGVDLHWARGGLPAKHLLHVGAAFIALLTYVPFSPEPASGAVAIIVAQVAKMPNAPPIVIARIRHGHINVGPGRLLLLSGLVVDVDIEGVQLFGSETIGARSPSELREVIVHLSGLAQDVIEPESLLVQQGGHRSR